MLSLVTLVIADLAFGQGRTEQKLSETTAMQLYNLEKLHMLRDPATNTKCLVAWGSDTLLISFRGTANRQNATHDVKVSQCHCVAMCSLQRI